MQKKIAVSMRGITKRFGSVVANNSVDLDVYQGEILAVLGENGCGKTTLMNMLAGIYYPDEGQIFVDGREVVIRSPKDAYALKIGMVHQHFKLVDLFTASENVVLGLKEEGRYNLKKVNEQVAEIAEKYGFHIEPQKRIYDMSVSEKQTVEIIKMLYRGANIPEGKKSVAFSLTLRSDDQTLTDAHADEAVQAVLAALHAKFGAVIR